MRPLRDSPVLLPGLPLPDSRRTAQDFDVLLLSTSLTCSEHEPLWRMLQLRLAVDAVETSVVLPAYVGLVTKWPTLTSKPSRMVVVTAGGLILLEEAPTSSSLPRSVFALALGSWLSMMLWA